MKVFIIAALTADGFIGRTADHLADWTSPEDKKLFTSLTKEAGVMAMGSRTFATIGRALPGRRNIVYTASPDAFTSVEGVEPTNESPADLIARLKQEGVSGLAVCGGASIYSLFMEAGVVEEVYITIEPVLFGTGITLFSSEIEASLTLLETRKLNDNTVLLHYAVTRS
jgi:dihydrofolate reductase